MINFNKILKVSIPLFFQVFSQSYWADINSQLDQSDNHRYIIKLNDTLKFSREASAEEFVYNKINSLINEPSTKISNSKSDVRLNKIIDGVYTVETSYDLDSSIDIIDDLDIDYMVKDRVGFFNPDIDEDKLLKKNPKRKPKTEPDSEPTPKADADDHSVQWNQFGGPAGINLESKPFANDGAWAFWEGAEGAKRKNNQVVVGVLDTGIVDNKNLNDNILPGWNFSGENSNTADETTSYHGAHVAGIIAAHGPQVYGVGQGKTSVKPNIKVLPIKIPKANGMFYESNVVRGIYWAIGERVAEVDKNRNPAKVLNMSFGIDDYVTHKETDECSPAVQKAIDKAVEKNVVIVVAAGNSDAEHDLGSPGGCKNVLRIASTGPKGLRSFFSNYGEGVSFAAPGGDKTDGKRGGILSTVKVTGPGENAGLAYFQGTSMAAPHVTGLIALVHALNDDSLPITYQEMADLLANNTHEFGKSDDPEQSCVGAKSCGTGIIDADKTLKAFVAKYYPKKDQQV